MIIEIVLLCVVVYTVSRVLSYLLNSGNVSMFEKKSFENKIVVITGASSGIGIAFTKQLYESGAKIIMAARRVDVMEELKNSLMAEYMSMDPSKRASMTRHGPKLVKLDLGDEDTETIERIAQQVIDIYGKIDIVINNAGISTRSSIMDTKFEVDRKTMFVNYLNQVAMTKVWLRSMIANHTDENRGHIVAISSVQGKIALPYRSSYSASKHALQAFYDSLRIEMEAENRPINVSIFSPGYVKTSLSLNALTGSGETHGVMDKTTAAGYEPEDVVNEILTNVAIGSVDKNICPLSSSIMIYVRRLAPKLFFFAMRIYGRKQYKKQQSGESAAENVS